MMEASRRPLPLLVASGGENGCGVAVCNAGCGVTALLGATGAGNTNPFGLVGPYEVVRQGPVGQTVFIRPHHAVPENVHIEITYACNLRCKFCYNPTRTKVNAKDKAVVWGIVRKVAAAKVPHVYLIGGEPTYGYTRDELNDMVEYLAEAGCSVTIVTNGQVRLTGITNRLACYGVSIHGSSAAGHDAIVGKRGAFERAVGTVRQYVEEGHDVRIIPVVMGWNHNQMYGIAELAQELGAESLFYDVYEPGGIGECNSHDEGLRMQPTYAELMTAIDQIIAVHDEMSFKGGVGFGTALPYCLHSGLVSRRMLANCGVGTYFGAITSTGDFRICNQSRMNFGNVLKTPLSEIWLSERLNRIYRELRWVQEPCSSCAVLQDCGGGCKVDESCPGGGELCIDRHVRGLPPGLQHRLTMDQVAHGLPAREVPSEYRVVRATSWLDAVDLYRGCTAFWPGGDRWVKTRYNTMAASVGEITVVRSMMAAGTFDERALVAAYGDQVPALQLRQLVTQLLAVEGLALVGGNA